MMATNEAKESLVFSVPEAGRLLALSRATAYMLANQGIIPTIRLGRRLVVPKIAIERMLAEAGNKTREKVYQELNHAFVTLGEWVESAPKPGAPVAIAAAKSTAAGPGNGGIAANGALVNAPFCDECGANDEVQLIRWTDKKTHEAKSGWKCQRCKKWAR
jgi:excisionase family DNA binding protein